MIKVTPRYILERVTGAYARAVPHLYPDGRSPWPLIVNCLLTYRCNLNCDFCMARTGREGTSRPEIGAADWNYIFRQIPSLSIIGLSGGELFCHLEVFEIIRAAGADHRFSIVTNGAALDEAMIHRLVAHGSGNIFQKGLVNIGISLNEDIADEAHCRESVEEKKKIFRSLAAERGRQKKRFPRLELKVTIRDDTAPFLDQFVQAMADAPIDAVTFQMLTSIGYMFYQGLDQADPERLKALKNYRNEAMPLMTFHRHEQLAESFAGLAALPAGLRRRMNFLPNLPSDDFLQYYRGRMNLSRYRCTNPWMHAMIDPSGVLYQCLNPAGVDLKNVLFKDAWNSPGFRDFRLSVRQAGVFNRCTGCCFLLLK